jgi:DNA-binding NtrC family response regulator
MTDQRPAKMLYTAILVCGEPDRLAVLRAALSKHRVQSHVVLDGASAIRAAKRNMPDFIFACHDFPEPNGMRLVESIKAQATFPVARGVIAGLHTSLSDKRRAMDDGADDYLDLDASEEEINLRIARLVARKQLGLTGRDRKMLQIMETIEIIAPTKVTVLITGESGTGKELIARAIHMRSSRRDGPFVAVNCGALPQGVLESELFGHEKGSFTGAIAQRKGRFEVADGGTLLLDEVGEMPAGTQVKLLRVLEEERFMRVGGSQDVKVDVRVLASTNRDLRQLVEDGAFRTDLFYRLNVVPIHVPPLRERKEDIPAIFFTIAEITCRKNNIEFGGISDEALSVLIDYHWPGNVRELRNLAESLVVLSGGKRIGVERLPDQVLHGSRSRDLPVAVTRPRSETERDLFLWRLAEIDGRVADLTKIVLSMKDSIAGTGLPSKQPVAVPGGIPYGEITADAGDAAIRPGRSVKDVERALIERTLADVRGNRKRAAKVLGIGERTLYRRMKQFGLK